MPTRRAGWRYALGASALIWSVIATVHGLASYTDLVRRGEPAELWTQLASYVPAYVPWVLYSAALYLHLARIPARATQPRRAAAAVALFAITFYLPQVCYQVLWTLQTSHQSLRTFPEAFASWPTIYWLVDLGLFLATFAAVAATVAVKAGVDAQQERQRLDAENLSLRLALERHRLDALRAQLEPHFLFNALNAISGLVRGDNRALALSALQQLSALLRYALVAAGRERVEMRDELDFARGYIALQALRYGSRLHFAITGAGDAALDAEVPPLILQPLIENAIRHDLECHEGDSRISVELTRTAAQLVIRVTNSVHPDATPNPGTGLGLAATRDRLALVYGPAASCDGSLHDSQFTATLTLPAVED